MKRWYVVQLYAGYEEVVRADILRRVTDARLDHLFGQILIPAAKAQQRSLEPLNEEDQQLFPGYILIELEPTPESLRLVTHTPRVIRFLGGKDPVPLSPREVDRVLAQIRGDVVVAVQKSSFEMGREIEITEGPFAGFVGIIESIDDAAERLTVMVSIFGRMTPVELGFNQVKR